MEGCRAELNTTRGKLLRWQGLETPLLVGKRFCGLLEGQACPAYVSA
jgi:hypothetical protein